MTNNWIKFVLEYKKKHPSLKYKQALKAARSEYYSRKKK